MSPRRRILVAAGLLVACVVLYSSVTFTQVWLASRTDDAQPAGAIVVLGAAQYDGRPSPVLQRRLDHALELWDDQIADVIVVTGGRRAGDRFTEAGASAQYLMDEGVPERAIRRETQGTNSWESLAAAARFLRDEGIDDVVLVSDDYHSLRIRAIAAEVGLKAHVSPADTELSTAARLRKMVREAGAVGVGRIISFRRLMRVDDVVDKVRESSAPDGSASLDWLPSGFPSGVV